MLLEEDKAPKEIVEIQKNTQDYTCKLNKKANQEFWV